MLFLDSNDPEPGAIMGPIEVLLRVEQERLSVELVVQGLLNCTEVPGGVQPVHVLQDENLAIRVHSVVDNSQQAGQGRSRILKSTPTPEERFFERSVRSVHLKYNSVI